MKAASTRTDVIAAHKLSNRDEREHRWFSLFPLNTTPTVPRIGFELSQYYPLFESIVQEERPFQAETPDIPQTPTTTYR